MAAKTTCATALARGQNAKAPSARPWADNRGRGGAAPTVGRYILQFNPEVAHLRVPILALSLGVNRARGICFRASRTKPSFPPDCPNTLARDLHADTTCFAPLVRSFSRKSGVAVDYVTASSSQVMGAIRRRGCVEWRFRRQWTWQTKLANDGFALGHTLIRPRLARFRHLASGFAFTQGKCGHRYLALARLPICHIPETRQD